MSACDARADEIRKSTKENTMRNISVRPSKYANGAHDVLFQVNDTHTTVVTLTSDELDELWTIIDEYRTALGEAQAEDMIDHQLKQARDADARGAMNVPFGQ
jgi:hypothetical protein